ncbi:MAG TPA: response regulator transcription factor [Symbiobacteriaceae bacterium]|nr:response regulator transcription factor [Symbiobacteriaceae bacterium]
MAGELILVVDDEERIADSIRQYLETEGFRVLTAAEGNTALDLVRKHTPDLVVLDVMMPGRDGWSVCREIRSAGKIPVIMVTARSEEADKLLGLELGADDYLTKPFSVRELAARIRTVLRRTQGELAANPGDDAAQFGPLRINFQASEVTLDDDPVTLTATELKLLTTLARRPGRVFSRTQLMEVALGGYYEGYERSIDTHISNLRKKIEPEPAHPRWILTVHGLGYKFNKG